jgi:hypothetical protein
MHLLYLSFCGFNGPTQEGFYISSWQEHDAAKSFGRQLLKMRKVVFSVALVILPFLGGGADAELMAIWDFGQDRDHYTLYPKYEYVIGAPIMSASGAEYDTNGKNGRSFTDEAGYLHPSGQAVGWDDVSGTESDAEWILIINTTGWQDMRIRWDYWSDATGDKQGPISFDFDYKVGNNEWTEILNNQLIIRDDAWHEFSYDLSSISAIENQPIVYFRVNDLDNDDLDGDYKFDNLQLTGIPDPGSVFLFAFGSFVIMRKKLTNT